MDFFCVWHQSQFNTVNHPFIKLRACPHPQCLEVYDRLLDEKGFYSCSICKHGYLESAREADRDESATREAINALQWTEVRCEGHAEALGEYFCSTQCHIYCENCKHEADCCQKGDLGINIAIHLKHHKSNPDLSIDLKRNISNLQPLSTQDCYNLLKLCLDHQKKPKKQTLFCSLHEFYPAEGLHVNTLQLGCTKCVDVERESYVSLGNVQVTDVTQVVKRYLRKIHCYAIPGSVLSKLVNVREADLDAVLALTQEISELPIPGPASIPETLSCPKCLGQFPSLLRLNCFAAIHGVCDRCIHNFAEGSIQCPLDDNIFASQAQEAKIECERARNGDSDMELPEDLPLVTAKVRSWRHWKGSRIPAPTIVVDSGVKVLSRFYGLYPPIHASPSELQPAMQPWSIDQSMDLIEAFVFTVSNPITLVGLTIACPLNPDTRMLVSQVEIRDGKSMNSPVYLSPFRSTVEISGIRLAVDLKFDTEVRIEAFRPYTLSMKLGTREKEMLVVYKGNQLTASDVLCSEGVDFWGFEAPETCRGFHLNGDNWISGPILRLFYRLNQ